MPRTTLNILPLADDGTTVCSNALCFKRAKRTNDPAKPPFCPDCTRLWQAQHERTTR